tara:strand:- start:1274 stop:1888 length:615 start_codon:yes stop_codon:yes gene_type:complete
MVNVYVGTRDTRRRKSTSDIEDQGKGDEGMVEEVEFDDDGDEGEKLLASSGDDEEDPSADTRRRKSTSDIEDQDKGDEGMVEEVEFDDDGDEGEKLLASSDDKTHQLESRHKHEARKEVSVTIRPISIEPDNFQPNEAPKGISGTEAEIRHLKHELNTLANRMNRQEKAYMCSMVLVSSCILLECLRRVYRRQKFRCLHLFPSR